MVVKFKLNHLQRVACLGIIDAVKTMPTSTIKIMLNLPPISGYQGVCVIWRRHILENPFMFAPSV